MKKKGFTLVELLAVIVILAVIALIATPTILGVIDKAKRSSLQDSGYGLVEAANLYYAQYSNGKTVRFDIEDNQIITETENTLNYKGTIKNGTVLINKKGQVTVCINDGKHAAYKNYQDTKVTVVDSKTCTIPESSYIVYLDGESTINEMTNQELTEEIELLKAEIAALKEEKATQVDFSNLNIQHIEDINTLNTDLSSVNSRLNTFMSSTENQFNLLSNSLYPKNKLVPIDGWFTFDENGESQVTFKYELDHQYIAILNSDTEHISLKDSTTTGTTLYVPSFANETKWISALIFCVY